jgi:hypothetical protein
VRAADSRGGFVITFPSVGCATKVVGGDRDSMKDGGRYRGCVWSVVSPQTYRAQQLDPAAAKIAILSIMGR